MQRVLMVLLLMVLMGSAIAEKGNANSFETALAALQLIEKVEKIYQSKTKEKKKNSSSKLKSS